MGRGAASSTAAVRGADEMAVLGRVPSGQRQVAQAELCQDLECHPARRRLSCWQSVQTATASPLPCGSSDEGPERKVHSPYVTECTFHSGADAGAAQGHGEGVDGSDARGSGFLSYM